jgi:hypothetical protein
MAKHGRLVRILFNEFSLSKFLKSLDLSADAAALDATNFESVHKEVVLDVTDGRLTAEGFYRGTVGDADQYLAAALNAGTQTDLLLVAPEGWAAVGKRAYMMIVDVVKKSTKLVATGLVMVTAEFQSESGINAGALVHALEAETATGSEASYHDNGAATSLGAVAQLEITDASIVGDESLVSVVQHSVDHVVWVDFITFDAATVVGAQRKSVAGTVNRYTRERHTVAGSAPSFTYAVGVARLKPSQI